MCLSTVPKQLNTRKCELTSQCEIIIQKCAVVYSTTFKCGDDMELPLNANENHWK